MGFDVNRFKSSALLKEIPRMFCTFCEKVLQEPMSLSTCGHVFCKNCVRDSIWRENICPKDRQPFSLQDIEVGPQALVQLLDNLEIACDYAALGCKEFVTLKQLALHCKGCPCRPDALYECPENCNKNLINMVSKRRSQQVITVVKEILDIERQVHRNLQELVKNLTLNEEKPDQSQRGIKRSINDLNDGPEQDTICSGNGFSTAHEVNEEFARKGGADRGTFTASTKLLKVEAMSSPSTEVKRMTRTIKLESEDDATSRSHLGIDVEAPPVFVLCSRLEQETLNCVLNCFPSIGSIGSFDKSQFVTENTLNQLVHNWADADPLTLEVGADFSGDLFTSFGGKLKRLNLISKVPLTETAVHHLLVATGQSLNQLSLYVSANSLQVLCQNLPELEYLSLRVDNRMKNENNYNFFGLLENLRNLNLIFDMKLSEPHVLSLFKCLQTLRAPFVAVKYP